MIEVKDLAFSYGKDKQALRGLNFTVEDGEIFGFLGPNGSGKSTTQKILTGILKGHKGKVWLFGQDISVMHTQEFFQKIGVLFEFPYLYANLSAVDNLKYFSSFYPKEQIRSIEEVLEELEFKLDWIYFHPFYHIYMGLKNAYFGNPSNSLAYYLGCLAAIVVLFAGVQRVFRREMGREG